MRSSRTLVAMLGVLFACGDASPCAKCPSFGGTYEMTWSTTKGFEGCTAQPPRPKTIDFVQEGSTLRATIGDAGLTGTLYDTFDFTLSGGSNDRIMVRGRAVVTKAAASDAGRVDSGTLADGGRVDAGAPRDAGVDHSAVHIVGTLTWSQSDAGCEARDDFSGDRQ